MRVFTTAEKDHYVEPPCAKCGRPVHSTWRDISDVDRQDVWQIVSIECTCDEGLYA